MVNHNKDNLNEIFHALADSTRREMVHMLVLQERTVSELAKPFDMSLAAISKHIKVLERANLVNRIVNGRTHTCRLNTDSLSQATEWLHFYEKFWSERFDHRDGKDYRAIGEYLEIDPPKKLVFTFKMPQFSESEDTITVELQELQQGCELTFLQNIIVPHQENWRKSDIEKALGEYHDGSEHGWNLMFMRLKELVETGQVSYKG